ncbi:uncharacterized protein [Apostichopus japonicus]|uniref:uncharacterized protein isoform X2 n=1 Tax=Stichopus japonicus TaxID=307972 RepID=UPI003AB3A2DB
MAQAKQLPANERRRDTSSLTQLHFAAAQGQLLVLHSLIKNGASVDVRSCDGYTPLHEACAGGHTYCAKNLIKAGANVNATSCFWTTPLHFAASSGSVDCVQLLLESGARVKSEDSTITPLHYAVIKGNLECTKLLTEAKCSLTQMDSYYGTCLHAAIMANQSDCSQHLLEIGANPNTPRPRDLQTPLHAAASNDNKEIVEILLTYGANPHLRDRNGEKAIDLATANQVTAQVLQEFMINTEKLSSLCRHSIRTSLGKDANSSVCSLPLPDLLKDYLCYKSP